MGLSKPRTIIATRKVDDSVEAEKIMLRLMRQCVGIMERIDLGAEWFEATSETYDSIRFILEVSMLAVRTVSTRPDQFLAAPLVEEPVLGLHGLESYFVGLDRFIAAAPFNLLDGGLAVVMREFDASNECPVFVNYLLHDWKTRYDIAHRKYSHMF